MRAIYQVFRATPERFRIGFNRCATTSQCAIDLSLQKATQPKFRDWKNAVEYARRVALGNVFRSEVHIAGITLLLIVIGTQIFIPFSVSDIPTRAAIALGALGLGTGITFILFFLVLPFHYMYRISLWPLVIAQNVATTAIFSLIEIRILERINAFTVPSYLELFFPVLLLHGLAEFFLLWQFKDKICVREHLAKYATNHLNAVLPCEKRGEIWSMSAADHYVEFTTDQGRHMARMTMKDAVAKIDAQDGLQVHRSHWVAYNAMLSIDKIGERHILTLRNGDQIPVSTRFAHKVRGHLGS